MQKATTNPQELLQVGAIMEDEEEIANKIVQVSELKGVIMENIEKVLDRGEKIEQLVDKTENLLSQAQDFRQQGTKMKRKMWVQNMKMKLVVLGIVVALILIVILSICHGFNRSSVLDLFWIHLATALALMLTWSSR